MRIPVLRRWAGTPGCRMIVRRSGKGNSEAVTSTPGKKTNLPGWEVLGEPIEGTGGQPDAPAVAEGSNKKRSASPADGTGSNEPPAKKSRLDDSAASSSIASKATPCRAPASNAVAQQVYEQLERRKQPSAETADTGMSVVEDDEDRRFYVEGEGDLFMTEGWRERWCRCEDVSSVDAHHFGISPLISIPF